MFVPAWQLAVHAHRKAFDEHIKMLHFGGSAAAPLDQAEYNLKVGVPTGVDDSDNFVTGLALDYTQEVGV